MNVLEAIKIHLTVTLLLRNLFLLDILLTDGSRGFAPKKTPNIRRHLERTRIFRDR
jgi:hypothetical protein